MDYILDHSGAKLVLVDHEFVHLVQRPQLRVIVSHDTGLAGDPYEEFLSSGRRFSAEKGWSGLEMEPDENANASLCYTYVSGFLENHSGTHFRLTCSLRQFWDHGQGKSRAVRVIVLGVTTKATLQQPKGVISTYRGECSSLILNLCDNVWVQGRI